MLFAKHGCDATVLIRSNDVTEALHLLPAASSGTGYEAAPGQVCRQAYVLSALSHALDLIFALCPYKIIAGDNLVLATLVLQPLDPLFVVQNYGQQSTQSNYGATESGPGIDKGLAAHVPGGQGVNTAGSQVCKHRPFWVSTGAPFSLCGSR